MKKNWYYIIGLLIIPVAMLLCGLLDYMELLQMTPYKMMIVLLVVSIVAGIGSPSHRRFDYLLTVIMPASMFGFMFVVGFLDKSDLETRFHLYKAVKASVQPFCVFLYALIALTTFWTSFRPVRNVIQRMTRFVSRQ